nr:MAG TPA: hypothetical protein [Caudoviricetes sp.]
MPEIKIKVRDKCAEGEGVIICNNSDYTVMWDLDEEWTPYDTKTMRVNLADGTYLDTVFTGNSATLPVLTASGWVSVGLYAGDIHTTRAARLLALSSVLTPGGFPAAPAEDVYAQIMAKLNELSTVSPDDIAKAVADYLAAHPIEETDPTVPEWAKAKTKPTYSAAEVGAISQSDLQAATDAALAQAKDSGEFDGPRGPAGAPGKDGAGMDLTGATVGQIARIKAVDASGVPTAWEPVDMPTGGGGEAWELIKRVTVEGADVTSIVIDKNENDATFAYAELWLVAQFPSTVSSTNPIYVAPNGKTSRNIAITPTANVNGQAAIFWMQGAGTFGGLSQGSNSAKVANELFNFETLPNFTTLTSVTIRSESWNKKYFADGMKISLWGRGKA